MSSTGEYLIKYNAILQDYPEAASFESSFTVTIMSSVESDSDEFDSDESNSNESDLVFNIMPAWLSNLENQRVKLGEHLVYILGNRESDLGTEIEVKLDYGEIRDIASYDPEYNALKING